MARDGSAHTLAGHGFEVLGIADFDTSLFRAFDDGLCQRVLRAFFQGSREAQNGFFGLVAQSVHIGQLRLAFGQGAGLIDDQRIDLGHAFQRFGVLDQDTRLRTATCGRRDRNRGRQTQSTGAGDDQH